MAHRVSVAVLGLAACAAQAAGLATPRPVAEHVRVPGAIRDQAWCDAAPLITRHEGSRSCSYTDTTGHRTVGVGFNLDAISASQWPSICSDCPDYHDVYSGDKCLSDSNIQTLLHYSMQDAIAESRRVVSNYGSMCCNVQNVVTDMTFNLGSLESFGTLVSYLEADNWAAASEDMKHTLWCSQVGLRCTEDAADVARGCSGPGPNPPPPPGPNPPPPPGPNPPPPPPPGPSPCKTCILDNGGGACVSRCEQCGHSCIACIQGGGGRACADRCC